MGLGRGKHRLLVTIGKVVAQTKSHGVSHMGRRFGPNTRFSARPWKDELGNGNADHLEGGPSESAKYELRRLGDRV